MSDVSITEALEISWKVPAVLDCSRATALTVVVDTSFVHVGAVIVMVNSFDSLTSY